VADTPLSFAHRSLPGATVLELHGHVQWQPQVATVRECADDAEQ